MNVAQAIAPMTKYRPSAATMAIYSQSGRPLGRRWSCICITFAVPGAPVLLLCSEGLACNGSAGGELRPLLGDHRLVGKSPEGSRRPGRETRTPLCVSVPSVEVR